MAKYWFRQKKFGYGATPDSWQGWLLIIVGAVATVAVIIAADFQRDNATRFLLVIIGLPLIVIPTILISHTKTEGGWRWRWGSKDRITVTDPVFKIVSRTEWAEITDAYEGSAHDRADGFLHFSTWTQLAETLRRYYAGKDDLLLVAADPARLGRLLKWEHSPSRGEDFPHLYGVLLTSAVLWVKPIAKNTSGSFQLPE